MNATTLLAEISDMAEAAANQEWGARSWDNFMDYLRSTLSFEQVVEVELVIDAPQPESAAVVRADEVSCGCWHCQISLVLSPILYRMGRAELTLKSIAGQPAECVNFILTARQLPAPTAS